MSNEPETVAPPAAKPILDADGKEIKIGGEYPLTTGNKTTVKTT